MTQTRFYRSRINPDELISNYAKEKVLNNFSSRNRSYNKNKNISIIPEGFNYSKEYLDNYRTNQLTSSSNYINSVEKNYEKPIDEIYFNYSNNLISNQRFNTYKSNCFLEKGKPVYNIQKLKENKNNKFLQIESNYCNNYLCNDCFRKKILLNENLNNII